MLASDVGSCLRWSATADGGLPGVLAGGVHGLRHAAGHVLHHPHHRVGHVQLPRPAEQQYALVGVADDEREGERRPARAVGRRRSPARARACRRCGCRRTAGSAPVPRAAARCAARRRARPGTSCSPLALGVRSQMPHQSASRGTSSWAGERGDHVLVELPGQELAGLGEERRAAAVGPFGGVAVAAAPGFRRAHRAGCGLRGAGCVDLAGTGRRGLCRGSRLRREASSRNQTRFSARR